MILSEKILNDMKTAMKSGDKQRLSTIRQLRAQIKNTQIEIGKELDDSEILNVLGIAAKRRKDAMEMYQKGGRDDLYAIEESELKIIQEYLPKQMSEYEVAELIQDVIKATGATGQGDLGKVMKGVMEKAKGLADGKLIQRLVREKLN
ncbi:MAG: GatB/YqeY domain-containing protein [Deferribacteres bacterium]|nr:GatB/YqeY domain-containing protein [candidate division KSB1 bacterium]MCB9503520.1 GatB/YqeY domain-containing protein [Deferribacteres bacterium]